MKLEGVPFVPLGPTCQTHSTTTQLVSTVQVCKYIILFTNSSDVYTTTPTNRIISVKAVKNKIFNNQISLSARNYFKL